MVTTEGVNFAAAWRLIQYLDINALGSNDIAAILRTYGVEAARHSIVSQVSAVFNAYGIAVDVRHLSLIADYMTFQGGFRPMNRLGMESNTSPWLKMTFETCMHFMSSAAEYVHVKSGSRITNGGSGVPARVQHSLRPHAYVLLCVVRVITQIWRCRLHDFPSRSTRARGSCQLGHRSV